mgnify:CR=1 FL=1
MWLAHDLSDATDFHWKVGQAIRWKLQLTSQLEVDTSTEATTAVPLFKQRKQLQTKSK